MSLENEKLAQKSAAVQPPRNVVLIPPARMDIQNEKSRAFLRKGKRARSHMF